MILLDTNVLVYAHDPAEAKKYSRAVAVLDGDDTPECGHNDHMERSAVDARELKARLGTYLRRVREGRTVLVTDRGEPIAELRPLPSDTRAPAALLKLAGHGAVTLPVRAKMAAFRMIQSRGRALSDAVLEDREGLTVVSGPKERR